MSEQKRKLAAILFADIAGYTALMQKDETNASVLLRRFQKEMEEKVAAHNGRIINFYGDGALCTFQIPLDAVHCAMELQMTFGEAPHVPVRMGIHSGTVTYEGDKIFGDSVNLASRIESMGVPGAILFSKKVRDDVKNQQDIKIASLGSFEFKNVEEPLEMYALANEGFPVPKKEEMQGKLRTAAGDAGGHFFQNIWQKKIPQILAVYILIAWLGLKLFDWALHQFGISPLWAQIFFISVIGIIPSLLVYLSNRERIHQRQFKRVEKILFPSNVIALGAVLFFMFRTADLGATTKNITFLNADGVEETQNIVKEAFRKKFPVFSFDPMKEDSANAWIGLVICDYIGYKLGQNKYLSPAVIRLPANRMDSPFSKVEKIQQSKLFEEPYYVDGRYSLTDGQYEFIPALRNKKNGRLIEERRFTGTDLLSLMDSIGRYLTGTTGLTPSQIEETPDLSIREMASDNLEALKHYCLATSGLGNFRRNMERALELDSTFAIAAAAYASNLHHFNAGNLEAKWAIDIAMRHRKRLPFRDQIAVMVQKHLIYKEWEKAEQLLNVQLEMDPDNEAYNNSLTDIYTATGQIDKLAAHTEERFARDPNPSNGLQTVRVQLMKGKTDLVIKRVKAFLLLDPQNTFGLQILAMAQMNKGDLDAAKENLEKIILIDPETELNIAKSLEAIAYMQTHPVDNEHLTRFEGAYRLNDREMVIELKMIAGQIYSKAINQAGLFMYPAGENVLQAGTLRKGFKLEFLSNQPGQTYAMKSIENLRKNESSDFLWKQDSTIWKAEELLQKQDYRNALVAYQEAISKNPDHYYLQLGKEHVEFMLSQSKEDIQALHQKYAGAYGDVNIWIENGQLLYKRPSATRRILLPVSSNQFTTLMNYSFIYEIVEKNGKVDGVQGRLYNLETKEWNLTDSTYFGFYARTKLLD